jgi:hypothetical protein
MERKIKITDKISLLIEIDEQSDISEVSGEAMMIQKIAKAIDMMDVGHIKATPNQTVKPRKPYAKIVRMSDDESLKMIKEYDIATDEQKRFFATKYGYKTLQQYKQKIANTKNKLKEKGLYSYDKPTANGQMRQYGNKLGKPWTNEEFKKFMDMRSKGISYPDIAKALGRTLHALYNKKPVEA